MSDPQPSSLTLRRSTVLVADDHAIVMEGVVKLLKDNAPGIEARVGRKLFFGNA